MFMVCALLHLTCLTAGPGQCLCTEGRFSDATNLLLLQRLHDNNIAPPAAGRHWLLLQSFLECQGDFCFSADDPERCQEAHKNLLQQLRNGLRMAEKQAAAAAAAAATAAATAAAAAVAAPKGMAAAAAVADGAEEAVAASAVAQA
jgi:hypothetical protein